MMKGQYNALSGTISHKGEPLYKIEGLWDERLDITNIRTKVRRAADVMFLMNLSRKETI
jgi:hypothetical protein